MNDFTGLQKHVYQEARLILDVDHQDVDMCMDLFHSRLQYDHQIDEVGLTRAIEMLVDDSLYWAGKYG